MTVIVILLTGVRLMSIPPLTVPTVVLCALFLRLVLLALQVPVQWALVQQTMQTVMVNQVMGVK